MVQVEQENMSVLVIQVKYKTGDFGHLSAGQGIFGAFRGYCDTFISITGELAVFAPVQLLDKFI